MPLKYRFICPLRPLKRYPIVCVTSARYERRLLDYSAFSYYCAIARQPCMTQVIIGRTDLLRRKHAENRLYAAEIPILAPRPLNGASQMHVYNLCHILFIYRCKYTK